MNKASRKLIDARLSGVQWEALLEVVSTVAAELPPERRIGACAVAAWLDHLRSQASHLLETV